VVIKIATSDLAGTFGDWVDFIPGVYVGRKFNFRADLSSTSTEIVAVLEAFSFTVDMPDRVERGTGVSLGSGGATVTYTVPFQVAPNVQVAIINAQTGDYFVISS